MDMTYRERELQRKKEVWKKQVSEMREGKWKTILSKYSYEELQRELYYIHTHKKHELTPEQKSIRNWFREQGRGSRNRDRSEYHKERYQRLKRERE